MLNIQNNKRKLYFSGYYRRAASNVALGKFKAALSDFELVHKRCPNDENAKSKFNECSKIVKRLAFEKAIAVEKVEKTLAEMFDWLSISIEEDYCGPKLEDGKVTLQFMENLLEWYRDQKLLHRRYAYKILCDVDSFFRTQPTLVDVEIKMNSKFTVCGDIHGQFYDLLNVFKINGLPSENNPYLFNGDFVDRGSFSVECIFTLFGFKLLYPNHFFMSRGNHETTNMNQMYGFTGEVLSKYNATMSGKSNSVWLLCIQIF